MAGTGNEVQQPQQHTFIEDLKLPNPNLLLIWLLDEA